MTKILKIGFSFLFLFAFAFTVQAAIPLDVVINEILPAPVGSDIEEEWIEIFNSDDFEFDISGWKLQDTVGKTKTYIFPEGTKITAKGFLVLRRPTTKITLNNDGDGLKLINLDSKTIDEISYEKAKEGKSFAKTKSGWVWIETLTPGAPNIIPGPISEPKKENATPPEVKESPEKELAAVGEQIPKNEPIIEEKSHFPLPIALIIAVLSGLIILILRRKIESKIS
jgi:hypothetical protein